MKLRDLKPGSNVELTVRMDVRIERASDSHGVTIKVEPNLLPGWTNREAFWIDEREVLDCVGPGERRSVFVFRDGEQLNFVEQLKANLLVTDQRYVAEKLARTLTNDTAELRATKEALEAMKEAREVAVEQRDLAIAARDDLRRHLQACESKRDALTAQLDTLQAKIDGKLEPLEREERAKLNANARRAHDLIDKLGDSSNGECINAQLHDLVEGFLKVVNAALAHRDYTDQCNSELVADNNRQNVEIAKLVMPVAMRLACEACGLQHIDEGEFATKPHHTHACQGCGLVWRPAIVPTVGVKFLPGFKNESEPPRASDGHAFKSYAERGPQFAAVSEFCQHCGGSRDAHTKG